MTLRHPDGTPFTAEDKRERKNRKRTPAPKFYPKTRAPRVDRVNMTEEEWMAHRKENQRDRSARYAMRFPGLTNGKLRKRRAEYPWYAMLLAAGDRSRNSGLEYNLTKEWAEKTYTGLCCLTNIPFITSYDKPAGKSGCRPYSPSIDRINPLKGYTRDNCRWVLFAVNSFKQQMTDQEMYAIAHALIANK